MQTLPAPGPEFTRDLLVRALGEEHGDRVAAEVEAPAPFSWLADADAIEAAQAHLGASLRAGRHSPSR